MSGTWWLIVTASEVAWVISITMWILFERRSPVATIAWILALALLPIVGVIIYLLIGPRRFDRKKVRREAARQVARKAATMGAVAAPEPPHGGVAGFMALGEAASGAAAQPRPAAVDLYFAGQDAYAAIVEAIAAAEHHVHLEYYIWAPDNIGTRMRDALVERAQHGVEVRLLIDGLGSASAKKRFWAPLLAAGGQVRRFNAITPRRLRPRMANFRTHRKIVVVDGRVGFTGGMNVTDVHTAEFSGEAAWRDTHLRLDGDAVRGLQLIFCEGWHDVCDQVIEGERYFPAAAPPRADDRPVQVMASGPDENFDVIHKLFVAAISKARRRVFLTAPYFVPDASLFTALTTAALSGVDVRVLVPAKNDLRLVGAASRSYYPDLLEHGVRIFEYGPPMLHAKTMVVDDRLSIIGTANADARSFMLNFEVIVACYWPEVCERMAEVYTRDLERALEIDKHYVQTYSFGRRLVQNFARTLSPTL